MKYFLLFSRVWFFCHFRGVHFPFCSFLGGSFSTVSYIWPYFLSFCNVWFFLNFPGSSFPILSFSRVCKFQSVKFHRKRLLTFRAPTLPIGQRQSYKRSNREEKEPQKKKVQFLPVGKIPLMKGKMELQEREMSKLAKNRTVLFAKNSKWHFSLQAKLSLLEGKNIMTGRQEWNFRRNWKTMKRYYSFTCGEQILPILPAGKIVTTGRQKCHR